MDGSASQVYELHKKFEALNEDVEAALKVQREALASVAAARGSATLGLSAKAGERAKKDALRLASRAVYWKEDVAALAKHIDSQLQHSRALRVHHANTQLLSPAAAASSDRQLADEESARLRRLRSDLRLLQSHRVDLALAADSSSNSSGKGGGRGADRNGGGQSTGADAAADPVAEETRQLQAFLEWSVKREKAQATPSTTQQQHQQAVPLAVELFERRRELMRQIAEDVLRDKLQRDADIGSLTGVGGGGAGDAAPQQPAVERDALAARDTQLFISFSTPRVARRHVMLAQTVVELQDELRAQFASQQLAFEQFSNADQQAAEALRSAGRQSPMSPPRAVAGAMEASAGGSMTLEEAQVAVQKLRRELAERSSANAKLALANSQLEDDLAHLQRKFEDEKRSHLSGRKWFLPKLQKLEEAMLATGAAFHEVKLSVDLVTNMYKTLSQQVMAQQKEEDDLKQERDRISQLLAAEIKKVALLTKDNERKDKLVAIAMAARHEMARHATHHEQLAGSVGAQCDALESRAQLAEDEITVLKQQLDAAYTRVATTGAELQDAGTREQQLQDELRVAVQAAQARELEMQNAFDRQQTALQQRLDKAKRELMEVMSTNLSLDSRLHKAQEKLARATAAAVVTSSNSTGDGNDGF